MCWQGAEDDERLEQGRRKSFKRTPNVATFQKMYMEKGRSATQTEAWLQALGFRAWGFRV